MDFQALLAGRVIQIQTHWDKSSGEEKKVRLSTQKPSVKHINLRNILIKSLMHTGRFRQTAQCGIACCSKKLSPTYNQSQEKDNFIMELKNGDNTQNLNDSLETRTNMEKSQKHSTKGAGCLENYF